MNVQVKLKVIWTNDGTETAPAWVNMPKDMPFYGSKEFRDLTIEMTIRKPFISSSTYDQAAIAVAHELSHVVLSSLRHPLHNCEKAVDLTAMLLGFSALYESGGHTAKRSGNIIRYSHLGYLTPDELRTAYRLLVPARSRFKITSRRVLIATLQSFAGVMILLGAIGAWAGANKVSEWWRLHQLLLSEQAEIQKQLPKPVGFNMTLVNVSVEMTSMTYTYNASVSKERIDIAALRAAARVSACENKQKQIKNGAIYNFEFWDNAKTLASRLEVSSCP
jgi:hypothetical protein